MANIKLEDYTIEVTEGLKDQIIAFLYEAGGELEAQVKRNTKVGESQLKGSWTYIVDENELKVVVGSPLENAIWEEFGTGEYALEGNGRKGGWWIPVGEGEEQISPRIVAKYKWIAHSVDKEGNEYVFTKGKKPKQAFTKAYTKVKPYLKRMLEAKLRG